MHLGPAEHRLNPFLGPGLGKKVVLATPQKSPWMNQAWDWPKQAETEPRQVFILGMLHGGPTGIRALDWTVKGHLWDLAGFVDEPSEEDGALAGAAGSR
jgi:hypothetical protein